MKKMILFILSAVMMLGLTGCTVYEYEGEAVLVPLYDASLGVSFIQSNRSVEALPVNITAEQADELFGSIEVYGANLALPMRLSDLPEGFTVSYEFDEDDLTKISKELYILDRNIYISEEEEEVRVALAGVLMEGNGAEDLKDGYIVSIDLTGIWDAVSAVKIKGMSVGALFNEEMAETYGEGYCYATNSGYVSRVYYDGERRLQFIYGGILDENGEIDIERTIKEGAVFSMNLTDFSVYEMMYRFDEGGVRE